MNVYAGVAGDVQDVVTFNAIMGAKKGADDDVVSVKVEPKAGKPGEWVITLTPKKSGRQTVYLLTKDKFGKEVWDANLKFVAMTNTVPMRDDDLPAGNLYLTRNRNQIRNQGVHPLRSLRSYGNRKSREAVLLATVQRCMRRWKAPR